MKKKFFAALLGVAMCLSLAACGGDTQTSGSGSQNGGSSQPQVEQPADLTGTWKQINSNSEETWQEAIIQADTITVSWVMDNGDSTALYWAGTFQAPSEPGDYSWDSVNDTQQTGMAILASGDETKTFTYSEEQLSYEVSALGTTTTVRMEKVAELEDTAGPDADDSTESEGSVETSVSDPDESEVYIPADMTVSQENALRSALSYLDFSSFSRQGLIDQLEYEQYTVEDATFAVDNCGADWNEQALASAHSYLDYSGFSYSGLLDQLLYEGFTQEEATYGVDNCGADWNAEAAESAASYLEYSAFSRDGLIDQLLYEGFTQEQAVYGVEQNGL